MNRIEQNLRSVIDSYKAHFVDEGNYFEEHILSLTSKWRDSGYVSNSLLTPSRIPLEFSYNFCEPSISYTLDPGMASFSISKKWDILLKTVDSMLPEHLKTVAPYRQSKDQRFGSWLSVRHKGNKIGYKVYQEVSESAKAHARSEVLALFPGLEPMAFETKLIGFQPQTKALEYYINFGHIDESILNDIMAIAGVARQRAFFVVQMADLKGATHQTFFDGVKVGASFKVEEGKPPLLTLFFHGPELFPSNDLAFSRLSKLGNQYGDAHLYDCLLQEVSKCTARPPIHSILSFKFVSANDFHFSVGFSPC